MLICCFKVKKLTNRNLFPTTQAVLCCFCRACPPPSQQWRAKSVFSIDLRCMNAVRDACVFPHPAERRRGGADVSLQGGRSLGWRHDGYFSLLKSWLWSKSQSEGLRANSIPELSAWTPSRHHISEEVRVYICLGFPADLSTALTMWLATESGGASAGSGRRLFSRYLRNVNG